MSLRFWIALVTVFPLAGLAGAEQAKKPVPAPAAKKERAVPFAPGEKLSYDISWSSYVTAGTATLSVVEKKPSYGSTAYYVVAEGRPTSLLSNLYDLYYKADSLIDVYTLLPQRGSVFSKEGRRERMKTTLFNHQTNTATYEVKTRTLVTKDMKMPQYSQDPLSAIYVLRALTLKAGDKFSLPICDAGETFRAQISVAAPELVKSGIGEVRAWRVTPTLPAEQAKTTRRLTVWISDDARRLPVKMQAQLAVGTFDLTLRSAGK